MSAPAASREAAIEQAREQAREWAGLDLPAAPVTQAHAIRDLFRVLLVLLGEEEPEPEPPGEQALLPFPEGYPTTE